MKKLRVYADTSVFGGVFDEEFEQASRSFFASVEQGRFRLVVSALAAEELLGAPLHVRALFDAMPAGQLEYHAITPAMEELRDAYLRADVLPPGSEADALHVAAATVLDADLIVSWNFRHIVNFERIRGFNAVNRLNGYKSIEIYSPLEVVGS